MTDSTYSYLIQRSPRGRAQRMLSWAARIWWFPVLPQLCCGCTSEQNWMGAWMEGGASALKVSVVLMKIFWGEGVVLCHICVALEGEWSILCMRGDACCHLAPSSFPQAPAHPLAQRMEEQSQLWWCISGSCPCLVAAAGVVWAWQWPVPVHWHPDSIHPRTIQVLHGSLACRILYWMTDQGLKWLTGQTKRVPRICQATTMIPKHREVFSDTDKFWCIY